MTDFIERLLELVVQIQQIPAPTFMEEKRASHILDLFTRENLQSVSVDSTGNVYGCLPGEDQAEPLIVSAHLDTVFPAETNLHITREADRISGPGVGDNSLGVAALLGLLWRVREEKRKPRGDIWFIANVGEEGLGDLRGMKSAADRFGGRVKAYLILEGMALGHVYHRAVGVQRYRVTARTAGGHSWSDYGQPSAVHELANLVTRITGLPVPVSPRTTLNVGKIWGGTGVNVLASEAFFELDLRSEGREALANLVRQFEELLKSANRPGVTIEAEAIGQRPPGEISPDHPLVRLAEECASHQGWKAELTSGSTDANIPLSRGYPAVVLGITTGGGAHTVHEYIETAPVPAGMEQLLEFVSRIWD